MALIFPQATPRQLKQLAKQLQAQAAAVLGVPLTLAQAQELAARAVGHEDFHAAQQHRPAADGQSTLEAMARRYVPLWKEKEVPAYPEVNRYPSVMVEGPSQLGGETRFRDAEGTVYRYAPGEPDTEGGWPVPEYRIPYIGSIPVVRNTSPWARFQPSPFDELLLAESQLKEHIWAGQLGLREDRYGLIGTAEELTNGLVSGLALMAHYLDRRQSACDPEKLLIVLKALCWLRDKSGQHLPLTRRYLMRWMDFDRLSTLANIPELPQGVAGPLHRVLVPQVMGDLQMLMESMACVDLEGRDSRLRAGGLPNLRVAGDPAPRRRPRLARCQ